MHRFLLFVVLLSSPVALIAQKFKFNPDACEHTSNKKAYKLYEKAMGEKSATDKKKLLYEAIGVEPNCYEALFELGSADFKRGKYDLAKDRMEQVAAICPNYSPYTFYMLGMMTFESGEYSQSVKYLEKFMSFDDIDGEPYDTVKRYVLQKAKDYESIFTKPIPFNPSSVQGICTEKDEYTGTLSPDNKHFYFIRKEMISGRTMDSYSDQGANYVEYFTMSDNNNGSFDKGTVLPKPFNQGANQGAATITADNKHMYFVICGNNQAELCDIWCSDYVNGQWTPIRSIGTPVNANNYWDSQPTISYDGKTMIFASTRSGGYGGSDLYITTKQENGKWSVPENLGPTINTDKHEMTPFLHSDSQTLYFSSQGHVGLGGYDIFYTRKDSTGKWKEPRNMGYPLNSPNDDYSFFVSLDGTKGFFSSDKLQGKGGWDIYTFDLYKEARPQEVLFVEGTVKSNTKEVVSEIELKNTRTKEVTQIDVDTADGTYVAVVNAKDDYVMTIKAKGVAFTSSLITSDDVKPGKPTEVNLVASDINIGEAYRLNDINFASNSSVLSDKAKFIIEEFSDFLKKNPTLKIAIYGHTDDVGNDQANLMLSDDRAKAVYNYLIQLGIDAGRLSYKGYGETKPVASNKYESGRQKNRRTEFVIISK